MMSKRTAIVVRAGRKEQVADDGGALELREVRRRDRRRHAIDRLRLPDLARGVDIGPQLGVEEAVDQAARREQLGEVVERHFDANCPARTESARSPPADRAPPGRRSRYRPQSPAGGRHRRAAPCSIRPCSQPAASGCGCRWASALSASDGSSPTAATGAAGAGGVHLRQLLLQVVQQFQHLVDRCAAGRRRRGRAAACSVRRSPGRAAARARHLAGRRAGSMKARRRLWSLAGAAAAAAFFAAAAAAASAAEAGGSVSVSWRAIAASRSRIGDCGEARMYRSCAACGRLRSGTTSRSSSRASHALA